MDKIDKIIQQWAVERPELDVRSMALLGRLKRLSAHISNKLGKNFTDHGLNPSNFDVLATLRRAGPPYQLSPNDLLESQMISSGTATNRIDQLEKKGYVQRIQNPEDKRSVLITLTPAGFQKIEDAMADHVMTQAELTQNLSTEEFEQLNKLLTKYLSQFENYS